MREINKPPENYGNSNNKKKRQSTYISQLHGMIEMKILVVYAASRLIIPIDSKQQDCLLHACQHGVRWDVFLSVPCCIVQVHPPSASGICNKRFL